MFNELFKGTPKFKYNSDNNEYVGITDFLKDHDKTIPYQVKGMFLTKGGKFGQRGIVIIDGYNIYVPKHVNDTITKIRSNPEMVEAINNGLCAIVFRDYEDKNKVVRTTVDFVDYAPTDGEPVMEF